MEAVMDHLLTGMVEALVVLVFWMLSTASVLAVVAVTRLSTRVKLVLSLLIVTFSCLVMRFVFGIQNVVP